MTYDTTPDGIGKGPLAKHLFLSSLFCAFLAASVLAGTGVSVATAAVYWVACAAYWLLFVALQIRWWRQGYAKFWRPIYAWALFVNICLTLIFLPVLLIPSFRRWLFRKTKPYDLSGDHLIRQLRELEEAGVLTSAEFEAKSAEAFRHAIE